MDLDEQMISDNINWVAKRAAQHGYRTPVTSSKPCTGMNHKKYRLSSKGLNVYLDVALYHVLKEKPIEEPLTIEITVGPDGDVA